MAVKCFGSSLWTTNLSRRSFTRVLTSSNYSFEGNFNIFFDKKSRNELQIMPRRSRNFCSTASEGRILKSKFPDVECPQGNLFKHVSKDWSKFYNVTAMECGLTGRSYSYGQLMDMIMRWCGALQNMGAQKGEMAAIFMPNCPEYPVILHGTLAAGLSMATINSILTPSEIAKQLKLSGTQYLIVDSQLLPQALAAIEQLQQPIKIFTLAVPGSGVQVSTDYPNVWDVISDASKPFGELVEVDNSDISVVPFSSGTTGTPKGVAVSHGAYTANINQFRNPSTYQAPRPKSETQPIILGQLPYFHIFGMAPVLNTGLADGFTHVTLPKFTTDTYLATIKKYKISQLYFVPPVLQWLAMSPEVTKEDLQHVHSVFCGASVVLPTHVKAFKEKAPNVGTFQEGWGMTEILIGLATPLGHERIGSCGMLLPNFEAKVVDVETGEIMPENARGELVLKSPSVMNGYYRNQKATDESFSSDGWFRTGDIVKYDKDDYIYIVDRTKELIKCKGYQVSPKEIEELLCTHPAISDAGVVGVLHEKYGEVPKAFVVKSRSVSEEEIHAYMQKHAAQYKQLVGGIRFVDQLPTSATGKLLRRELRELP